MELFLKAARLINVLTLWTEKIVQATVVLIFVTVFIFLNVQVGMRYVLGIPLIWVEELMGFLMAYITLWGSSSCIRSDTQVRVSFLPDKMKSPVARHWLSIGVHGIVIFYLYYLIIFGFQFAAMGRGEVTPSGTFEFFVPRLALATGGVLMLIQAVGVIFREISGLLGEVEAKA